MSVPVASSINARAPRKIPRKLLLRRRLLPPLYYRLLLIRLALCSEKRAEALLRG
jgi:hypothetical protein